MVKLSLKALNEVLVNVEIELDIYPKKYTAVMKIQDKEFATINFSDHIHNPGTSTVQFYGTEEESVNVNYDCVRIW